MVKLCREDYCKVSGGAEMRADKSQGECTEECKFNHRDRCRFGPRHIGCYLDQNVKDMCNALLTSYGMTE